MEHSLTEIFQIYNCKISKLNKWLEEQIMEHAETEVTMRMSIRTNDLAQDLARSYKIPVESLLRDMSSIETRFCKGIKGDKTRCLKNPKANGYCGFHQSQVPPPKPPQHERVPCFWELDKR